MSGQSNTQKVFKGVSAQTLITILMGVMEIVSFSIMSRLLNQQDFGYYAAITAISSIFAAFSDAGIGSAIVQRKNLDQEYLNNAFTLSLLFGFCGTFLLLVCSGPISNYIIDGSMKVPLMLVSITLLTGTLASVNFSIMHRKLQFLLMGAIRISALLITTIVSIILAIKGFGYYAILAKSILYSIITLVVSYIYAHTKYKLAFDIKVYKEIFGFGGWLMASAFFRKIADQIDRLMMSALFNVKTLGMYSRPKEFINSMTGRITDIFDSALFPVLSSVYDDNSRVVSAYKSTLYYMNIVGLIITLTFIFNSELIIRIFLGVEWMNVNTLFIVLSISSLLMVNGSLGDVFLRSLAFTKQQFYFRILQAITTILFILIASRWGVLAVAQAYLLAYGVIVLAKMVFIANRIKYGFGNALGVILSALRVSAYYLPIYILCRIIMPNTLTGNIIKLVCFCLITVMVFLICPILVGTKYKNEMYGKVLFFLKDKVLKYRVHRSK